MLFLLLLLLYVLTGLPLLLTVSCHLFVYGNDRCDLKHD